jgi:hypothetical protein
MLSARVVSVEGFFQLGTFGPASIQRDYVWEDKHSKDLFNDIERASRTLFDEPEHEGEIRISIADDKTEEEQAEDTDATLLLEQAPEDTLPGYHLGGVVLLNLGSNKLEVFDGLQRTTTLTILLCVIRDLTATASLRARIRCLIKDNAICRITLPGVDQTLKNEIQNDGQAVRSFRRTVGPRGMRIRQSRSIFHTHLRNYDQERLFRFGKFLLERTFMVVAQTEYRALARQVFITSNDRGVTLGPIDLFKSQLLTIAGDEQAAEIISGRWTGIMQVVRNDLDEFLRVYDFIKRRDPQGADHLAKLADQIEKRYGPDGILNVMDEILDYASAWVDLRGKFLHSPKSPVDFDIWKLRLFKWSEWKPLALAFYKDFRDKKGRTAVGTPSRAENLFWKRVAYLQRACMLITLIRFSASDREKIFAYALSQFVKGRDPFAAAKGALAFTPRQIERAPETLRTPLYDGDVRLSLLKWAEACLQSPESLRIELWRASVEHVLPLRPEPGSQWLTNFPDEDERFLACHSIGNLAIMDFPENEMISNRDFKFKLETIRAQAGKYRTLTDIADKTSWTYEEIHFRAERMIEIVCTNLNIAPSPQS